MTRDEATQELVEWITQMIEHGVPNYSTRYKALKLAIEALQQEPVKHGKWEKNEPLPSEWQYKCSECGVPSKSNSHNFCPNCGAKMDKD